MKAKSINGSSPWEIKAAQEQSMTARGKIAKLPSLSSLFSFKPHVSIGFNSGEVVSENIR